MSPNPAGSRPEHAFTAAHTISNGELTVAFADHNALGKPRFDRSGFITQVTRQQDGRTYCVTETGTPDPNGGIGLCGEFGLFAGIGYEEAAVGEPFMKLGVGLLTKTADVPYNFFAFYPVEPFDIITEFSEAEARFTVLPKLCNGYAARLDKVITLEGNSVIIHYTLENAGEKPVRTTEYVHNFMGINGEDIGPDYSLALDFPCELLADESVYPPELLQIEGNRFSWAARPEKQQFYCRLATPQAGPGAAWELTHRPSGARVREEISLPLALAAVWGTTHVVSPELFAAVEVMPGETLQWTRRYSFG